MLFLVLSVLVPLSVGAFQGISMKDEVTGWYSRLRKPRWTPPGWLFGPVWTLLYTGMGVSAWLVWRSRENKRELVRPMAWHLTHLTLNFAWTPLFFTAHNLKLALLDILALDAAIVGTSRCFREFNPMAAELLQPYLAWTSFATLLNTSLMLKNPGGAPSIRR